MRHPSKAIESMLVSGSVLFLLVGMSGVSTIDAIKVSLFFMIQVLGGVALWSWVTNFQRTDIPTALGMGLALGTAVTTISQYLLRETVLKNYSWLIPLLFLIPMLFKQRHRQEEDSFGHTTKFPNSESISITFIVGFTALAMASLWWWLHPLAIALLIVGFLEHRITSTDRSNRLFTKILIPSISIVGFSASFILQRKNDFWKVLSNDQVFSESLSWSIFEWGKNDSPFAAGMDTSYHWFVLLLSGITSSATNAESWVVITRVIPIASFLGIFSLIWTLTRGLFGRTSAPIISCLFLIFYSTNFGFSISRYIVSPTFLFSCIWLLAFVNAVFFFSHKPSVKIIGVSAFLLFMTFGGKVMNGAIAMSAVLFSLFFAFILQKTKTSRIMLVSMATASFVSLLLIYLVMFRSTQPGNLNTLVIKSLLPIQLGLLPPDKTGFYLLGVNLFLFVAMTLPLLAILCYAYRKSLRNRFEVWFIVGSILAGIVLTFSTSHPGSSQLYFWLSSIPVAAILAPAVLYHGEKPLMDAKVFVLIGLIGVFGARASILIWSKSNLQASALSGLLEKMISVGVGLLIIFLLMMTLHLILKRYKKPHTSFLHFAVLGLFLIFNLGIGANQQFTNALNRSKFELNNKEDPNLITGSRDHLEILNWLRNNTDKSDVVATNRFCIPGPSYCISKWQLVSAVSHRRLLFEGGYFELPAIPDVGLYKRYVASSDFGIVPSPIGLRRLCDYNVRWYFYDHSVSVPRASWEPYASAEISNVSATLLKLRCPE
jgi:hypothetical protein